MAHFKRGNLQLKTNQQIQLGDSQETLIKYDGTQLSLTLGAGELALDADGISVIGDIDATGSVIVSGGIDVEGHSAMGADAPIDVYSVLNINETFDLAFAVGANINVDNIDIGGSAQSFGVYAQVQNDTSTSSTTLQGGLFAANQGEDGATVTNIVGVGGSAALGGDLATITNMIGGDFYTIGGFGYAGASVTNMIGAQVELLKYGGTGTFNVTNSYGLLVKTPAGAPGGTKTNLYGLYIEDQSTLGFVNDYNIFSAGANSLNKFEGSLELASGTSVNEFSIDGTLAGDSDDAVPTEQAVKTYVETYVGAYPLPPALLPVQAWNRSIVPLEGAIPVDFGTDYVVDGSQFDLSAIVTNLSSQRVNWGSLQNGDAVVGFVSGSTPAVAVIKPDGTLRTETIFSGYSVTGGGVWVDVTVLENQNIVAIWASNHSPVRGYYTIIDYEGNYISNPAPFDGGEDLRSGTKYWVQALTYNGFAVMWVTNNIPAPDDRVTIRVFNADGSVKVESVTVGTSTAQEGNMIVQTNNNILVIIPDAGIYKVYSSDDGSELVGSTAYTDSLPSSGNLVVQTLPNGNVALAFRAQDSSIDGTLIDIDGNIIFKDKDILIENTYANSLIALPNNTLVFSSYDRAPAVVNNSRTYVMLDSELNVISSSLTAFSSGSGTSSHFKGTALRNGQAIISHPHGQIFSFLENVSTTTIKGDLDILGDTTAVNIFASGDIYCDDLYTSGDTIHVGTGQIKSTAGNVELYHSTSKVVETIATGLQAGVAAFDIKTSGGEDGITINNDGGVDLFHDNVKQFETIATGIQAAQSTFDIKTSTGQDAIKLNNIGAAAFYYNTEKSCEVTYRGIRAGQTEFGIKTVTGETAINMISNQGVKLYWNDNLTIETNPAGMQLTGGQFWPTASCLIGFTSTTEFKLQNAENSGEFTFRVKNGSGTNRDALNITYDGISVIGDLQLTGVMPASDLDYAKVGTPTYSTAQQAMDQLGSAGLISGGIISLDGTTSVNVTAGTGMLRTSNDIHAPLVFIDFSETLSIPIPGDDTKNIVVNYNSGTPIVEAIDPGTFNANTYFILGQVGRAEDDLIISNLRQRISDFSARILGRLYSTGAIVRVGQIGLILGESADTNRYVTMTEGDVWALLDIESLAAINTGTGDDFTTIYRDTPSGYVETPGETQWDMLSYDDGSGTLKDLSNGRYGVRWFWLIPSDESLFMVYGTGNWRSLAEAEAEPVPTDIPSLLGSYGILLGRIIVLKNQNIAIEVSTSFDTTYDFSGVTDHGNLSNLGSPADDHTQYSLVTGARDFTGTVGGIDPVAATDFTTLGYMATLGTDRVRLTYDGTSDLDISVEHVIDIKYADFDITSGNPPWKEGRVFWDNEANTFGVYNDVSDVTLQVGQETHIKIRNETGDLISNGTLCYVSGSAQGRALVELADASVQDKTEGLVVVTHDLANNTDGYGTIIGMVRGIDTMGFSDGEEIYLSETTPGAYRAGRPDAPNYVVDVGFVIVGDSTANGEILVSFINHGDFATLADVNIPIPPTSGQTLVYDEDTEAWSPETSLKVISYTLPLSGVVDTVVPLTGTFITKGTGETGDVAVDFTVSNQHVWILINSITGADSTGSITLTGISVSESTAVPVLADTEVITIDSTAGVYYQSHKKWWEVTNIAISGDISAINFDYGVIGYPDLGNKNFKIVGYRMDAFAAGNTPDMRLIISKINDLGDNKVEIVDLEDIGVDSGAAGNQIIDHVRTGGQDRSVNTSENVWLDNETLTFKQLDFDTYWTNDENHVLAADGDSGYVIRIEGEPDGGGITNVDFVDLLLYYALL